MRVLKKSYVLRILSSDKSRWLRPSRHPRPIFLPPSSSSWTSPPKRQLQVTKEKGQSPVVMISFRTQKAEAETVRDLDRQTKDQFFAILLFIQSGRHENMLCVCVSFASCAVRKPALQHAVK